MNREAAQEGADMALALLTDAAEVIQAEPLMVGDLGAVLHALIASQSLVVSLLADVHRALTTPTVIDPAQGEARITPLSLVEEPD